MAVEDLLKAVRHAWLTYTLALINVMVYIYELYLSGSIAEPSPYALLKLGLVNILVTEYHEWWRLFTAMFVHLSWIHLAMNTFFLIYLGSQLELFVGKVRYLVLYITAGLFGNVLTVALMDPYTISGGASGALFGIAGALIMIEGVLKRNIQTALANAFFLFLINSWMPHVNAVAHLGGLLVGIAFGYLYGNYVKEKMAKMLYWDEFY
ncbi:integral membrane protein rhomboid-like protein [Thermococcus guaymasensis DSM 11113]|uniref:Integral membrane protein rhomboid-like protein n=1 Tax=Thermococcus guaymasensis DSM 11113 TaxID=1432656 RepID=A0A0X1KMU8_9EURY|nr:rhomboid family intramembrane serine protease [Thermococcus guaymasensis]AJC72584.1 integral membrane protein rhomboid-like protein [Thermococcus guaymasensis DSM 11113]